MPETDTLRAWLEETKCLASCATPGPWDATSDCMSDGIFTARVAVARVDMHGIESQRAQVLSNMAHIARCDPQTVTVLVSVVEAAEQDADDRVNRGEWVPGPLLSALAALRAHVERQDTPDGS